MSSLAAASGSSAQWVEGKDVAVKAAPKVVLVTGGSGLVGQGIRTYIEKEGGLEPGERWFFARSKDADLRDLKATRARAARSGRAAARCGQAVWRAGLRALAG